MMEEFSKDIYKVDILKVEFPVNVAFVDGAEPAYSREQALDYYRRADALAFGHFVELLAAHPHQRGLLAEQHEEVLFPREQREHGADQHRVGHDIEQVGIHD